VLCDSCVLSAMFFV